MVLISYITICKVDRICSMIQGTQTGTLQGWDGEGGRGDICIPMADSC